jgi:hypothetical protein
MKITIEYPSGIEQNGWENWTTQNEKSDEPTRSCLQIEVMEVPLGDGDFLIPKSPPLKFYFFPNDERPYYEIEHEELNISVYGDSLKDLEKMLYEEMAFLWESYALENDANMTSAAQELKKRLLKTFEVS